MNLSVFELFRIGIGPSSSHTVGPMRAARTFVLALADAGQLGSVATVKVELFGSLGATGRGHGSDKAVLLGLMGETPEGVAVAEVDGHDVPALRETFQVLPLAEGRPSAIICHTVKGKGIDFLERNLAWHHKSSLNSATVDQLFAALKG